MPAAFVLHPKYSLRRQRPSFVFGFFSLLLAGFVWVTITPRSAHAQSVVALLEKGNKLFTAGNYQKAYEVFLQANRIKPKAVFLRSMAFCQLKLFQHEKARANLQQYLQKYRKAKDYKKIKGLMDSLDVVVQTKVDIRTTPSGAAIYIDAEAAGKVATTPQVLTIRPGKHILILKADGYITTSVPFTVGARETEPINVTLKVPFWVTSNPAGATVHVDSKKAKPLGQTPLKNGIEPGKHRVYLKLAGYQTYVAKLEVSSSPAKPVTLDARMTVGLGVSSKPSGARVLIDGKPAGKTPLHTGVERGKHQVMVKMPGFKPVTEEVLVEPGKAAKITVVLEGGSLLRMRTPLSGTEVVLGKRKLGQTPLDTVGVPVGSQLLSISHPDRRSWSDLVTFKESEILSADVTLARSRWPIWVAGGVTAAGLVLGIVGTVMAQKYTDDYELVPERELGKDRNPNQEWCREVGGNAEEIKCPFAFHHLATTGYIIAGVAAGAGLLYYLIWGRHKVVITRKPINTATISSVPSL
jgi:hypothetical protein